MGIPGQARDDEAYVPLLTRQPHFLVMHKNSRELILLPRHSQFIATFVVDKKDFQVTLDAVFSYLYKEDIVSYRCFEPGFDKHKFLWVSSENVHHLIKALKSAFPYDFLIENKDTCKIYLYEMGGHVRFNLGVLGYGVERIEVGIFYSDEGVKVFTGEADFLLHNGAFYHK